MSLIRSNRLETSAIIHEKIFLADQDVKEVHASTLVLLENGSVLASWFGGTKEGHDDVGIWLACRNASGWNRSRRIVKISDEPHWNPVMLAEGGRVHLWFKVGKPIPQWRTYVMTSNDDGQSWTEPRELVLGDQGGRGPVKNKPIILTNGAWLAPASIEVGATPSLETGAMSDARWDAFVDRSEDKGITWQRSELIEYDHEKTQGEGIIQPALWESKPGMIHMLLRSGDGWIYRSDSEDDGRTWCAAYRTELPNNNSGIDLARLADGTLALVYNPVNDNWGGRSPLTVALSDDNGLTWPCRLDLETVKGEFSYPAIIATEDGMAVTYTHCRKTITYWQATLESIQSTLAV